MGKQLVFKKYYDTVVKARSVFLVDKNIYIPWFDTDKLVYHHMLHKFLSFKAVGLDYFESQQTISEEVGCSLNSTKRSILKLSNINLLEISKVQKKGFVQSCTYTNIYLPDQNKNIRWVDGKGNILSCSYISSLFIDSL